MQSYCLRRYAAFFLGLKENAYALEGQTSPSGITLSWSENPAKNAVDHVVCFAMNEKGAVQYIEQIGSKAPDFSKAEQIPANCIEVSTGALYRFEATLENLRPDTAYWYRVKTGSTWSGPLSFRTAAIASGSGSFQFMYLGDVQFELREQDYQLWSDMISRAYKNNPALRFSLLGGDYVNSSGNIKDWNCFLQAAEPVFSRIPMMTVPGKP